MRVTKWHGLLTAVTALFLIGCDRSSEPMTGGTPAVMRRLTQDQYKHIIADIFGPDIHVSGRMDPDVRKDGLFEIGATQATFTPGSLEQYDQLARNIATEVLDPKHRASFMPCAPAAETAPDPACAKQVIAMTGRLLFRRPLTEDEITSRVDMSNALATKFGNFYQGLQYGMASLLEAPSFLFRKDGVEADPDHSGQFRLDSYSRASRLSFLIWDSAPDDTLLNAAAAGELYTEKGLRQQADRMLSSPRLKDGVRGFFDDFLQFSQFESLDKDPVIYPKFSQSVSADAREQTLRTIVELLVNEDGDYRDLFTTRKTFMSRSLGVVYQVPVQPGIAWTPYEFAANDPRAGLLTQLSFTAMYAPPGRSSPTLRGKAIREALLCETVPTPPVNVDFSNFENTSDHVRKTARERLTAHRADPACAGCHAFIDPMGLALENFDGLGAYRTKENGAAIDASGELDGVKFTDALGLGKAMHDSPAAAKCLVKKVYGYAVGEAPTAADKAWMDYLQKGFADDGYKFPQLLRRIATSEAFYRVAPVAPAPSPAQNNASNDIPPASPGADIIGKKEKKS
jgi:hypothetical protein